MTGCKRKRLPRKRKDENLSDPLCLWPGGSSFSEDKQRGYYEKEETHMSKGEQLKAPIVQEISELLSGATAAVLVDYKGITVEQDTNLRKELRTNNVTYRVYKNTLLNRAVKDTVFAPLAENLSGRTAIAVTKADATAPARIIANFDKKGEMVALKAGVIEGTYYGPDKINAVALIPSREILLGRLFGSMKSPITNFARVLKQMAEKQEA